jgi:alkanesulfonate monooxygenase SsuD/methylene tetrahydromethanopterin reductase-like flavin-dependent oxidoreductase (luciferase family)
MLGDAEDWDELDRFGSIIVGSPETVLERLLAILRQAPIGYLLVQFHMGNARPEHVRGSMRLFAEKVAPTLRSETAEMFARQFPALAEEPAP